MTQVQHYNYDEGMLVVLLNTHILLRNQHLRTGSTVIVWYHFLLSFKRYLRFVLASFCRVSPLICVIITMLMVDR